jgi:hypothetical protein
VDRAVQVPLGGPRQHRHRQRGSVQAIRRGFPSGFAGIRARIFYGRFKPWRKNAGSRLEAEAKPSVIVDSSPLKGQTQGVQNPLFIQST